MPTAFLHQPFLDEAKALLMQPFVCPPETIRLQVAGISCSIHEQEYAELLQDHFHTTFHGKFLSAPQSHPADLAIHSIMSAQLSQKHAASVQTLTNELNLFYQKAVAQKHIAPQPNAQHSPMMHAEKSPQGWWIYHTRFVAFKPLQGPTKVVSLQPTHLRPNVQTLWKFLLHHALLKQGGALLHASGIVHKGQAHLFAGTSGSGKTTATRNALQDAHILSDELVILRPTPQDPHRFDAYGTPFYGDWNAPGEEMSAPLAGIHFLKHAERPERIALHPREAFRLLARVLCFSHPTQEEQTHLMMLLDRLLPSCDRLATPPTNAYWMLLDPSLTISRTTLHPQKEYAS